MINTCLKPTLQTVIFISMKQGNKCGALKIQFIDRVKNVKSKDDRRPIMSSNVCYMRPQKCPFMH